METFTSRITLERAAFWLAAISAATIPVSVAASHTTLALAFTALALSAQLRIPPVTAPALAFILLTLLSAAASPHPLGAWPQIKKFYVWLMLVVAFSALRSTHLVRRLWWAWIAAGTVGALWSFVQYYGKWSRARAAGENFYLAYIGDRITGFMSHWMTFSGHMMMILLIAAALLIWTTPRPKRLLPPALMILMALVLSQTRGMWVATMIGGAYLIASWRPRLLTFAPVAIVIGLLAAPPELRQRAISIVRPHGNVDSNQHRIVCWRTGWEMIKANPLLGVGPEQVGVQFDRYVPADIARPLPTGYYKHLHSIYVHYAAERGVPALLALLWLIASMLWEFGRCLRRLRPVDRDRRAILHGAIAVIIGLLVSGVTETNLGDSEVLAMFMATAACGYVAVAPEENKTDVV